MILSPEQSTALELIEAWHSSRAAPDFRLAGWAGTGKSALIHYVLGLIPDAITLAPTGKACSVLWRKQVAARTIHSYLYHQPSHLPCPGCRVTVANADAIGTSTGMVDGKRCRVCRGDRFILHWPVGDPDVVALLIVDEASMVGMREYRKLLELSIPILWVGDPAQLAPVSEDPRIMHTADFTLEQIHRTNRASILELSTRVRRGEIPSGPHVYRGSPPEALLQRADAIICATNRKRQEINRRLRFLAGREGLIAAGDKVICRRNSTVNRIVNGDVGTVLEVGDQDGETVEIEVEFEHRDPLRTRALISAIGADKPPEIHGRVHHEITIWDYGYAFTAHNAQGSEWPKVCVIEEKWQGGDPARLRYTAITRASERLGYYR